MDLRRSRTYEDKSGLSLICPSTRAFWEESRRTPSYSFFDFLHGYLYSRWPYLYISMANGEHRLAYLLRKFSKVISSLIEPILGAREQKVPSGDWYHAKILTEEGARQLITLNEDIRLENLEQVIPYRQARDLILTSPDHIVVIDCPCRASRSSPCMPLDVCLIVGEPFASLIIEHHPKRARWIDIEEACAVLEAAHSRGHVHHAFFNGPMLNRFFGICNCCPCCCSAMQAMRNGISMIASSGYISSLTVELCSGCGECVQRCPFEAMREVVGVVEVDETKCMGCGICVSSCQFGALSLVRDSSKSEPLEIDNLINLVKTGELVSSRDS